MKIVSERRPSVPRIDAFFERSHRQHDPGDMLAVRYRIDGGLRPRCLADLCLPTERRRHFRPQGFFGERSEEHTSELQSH